MKRNILSAFAAFVTLALYLVSSELTPIAARAVETGAPGNLASGYDLTGTSPQFVPAGKFSDGMAPIRVGDDESYPNWKIGYVDKTGKVIIPPVYDLIGLECASFSEGAVRVAQGENYSVLKYGYLDKAGNVIVPLVYDYAGDFSEGLACVGRGDYTNRRYGYIDKTGKVIVPLEYNAAGNFFEGLAVVGKGKDWNNMKWGYIDKTGYIEIPLKYDAAGRFSEGLARVGVGNEKNRKYGYIDKTGKVVVPPAYDYAGKFSDGLAMVIKNKKCGYINKNGKIIIRGEYGTLYNEHDGEYDDYAFSEGLVRVVKGKWEDGNVKYGFINKAGKVVVPLEYDYVWDFSEGTACVRKNGKRGYIDKTGKIVIPVEYGDKGNLIDWPFSNGLTVVENRFLDMTGSVVLPEYHAFYNYSEGLAWARKDGKLVILQIVNNSPFEAEVLFEEKTP